MMTKYDNLLAGKNQTIRALWAALAIAVTMGLLMGAGWMTAPQTLRVHVPPDLSNGAVLNRGEIRKGNIYSFAFYIWQQLNRWEKSGVTDYEDKIHMLQAYLTPSCFQDRLDDFEIRKARHELDRRERSIWEIPGRGFNKERVYVEGPDSWVVYLDMHINETMLGETIKERFVNYPIRVVRYNIDPEKNAWGLALDCLADTPRVIELESKAEDPS